MLAPRKKTAAKSASRQHAAAKPGVKDEASGKLPTLPAESVEVLTIRQALGVNRKTFSRLSGYSERAVAAWESGKPLSDSSRQRMMELQRLERALSSVMQAEFISQWLQTPNDGFGGLKPVEVIERGEIDRIWRMVYLLESGVAG
ncbi:MAG: DUF2384 domain-containing protein [Planctomycetes bacterium]|nr:DUF2384 domain-containing protein [Planctomycetota bacterium]